MATTTRYLLLQVSSGNAEEAKKLLLQPVYLNHIPVIKDMQILFKS